MDITHYHNGREFKTYGGKMAEANMNMKGNDGGSKFVDTNSSRKKFTSKWEYIKSFSQWHFDKWKKEQTGDQAHVMDDVLGDYLRKYHYA